MRRLANVMTSIDEIKQAFYLGASKWDKNRFQEVQSRILSESKTNRKKGLKVTGKDK